MKIIIAGSRTISEPWLVGIAILKSGWHDLCSEVVSGGAKGVDRLGETWAKHHEIPIKVFPVDWSHGKSAGPLRNDRMAEYADALIAVWDGTSKGTKHMIGAMKKLGKPVYLLNTSSELARQVGR